MISDKRKQELDELLTKLNINCNDYEKLNLALTHSSYTYENNLSSLQNNERLEFFGDAVLKLIASERLYERFPEYSEGELTKIRSILVSDNTLAKIAEKIELGKYIQLGYHEEKSGGRNRKSTIACAFEAMLGALFFAGKQDELKTSLIQLLDEEITIINNSEAKFNYKAILQEYTQAKNNELPLYETIDEQGPAHDKTFTVSVLVDNTVCGTGIAKTKKLAQQIAAEKAINKLGILSKEKEEATK